MTRKSLTRTRIFKLTKTRTRKSSDSIHALVDRNAGMCLSPCWRHPPRITLVAEQNPVRPTDGGHYLTVVKVPISWWLRSNICLAVSIWYTTLCGRTFRPSYFVPIPTHRTRNGHEICNYQYEIKTKFFSAIIVRNEFGEPVRVFSEKERVHDSDSFCECDSWTRPSPALKVGNFIGNFRK